MEQKELPSLIPHDELAMRERMRADLAESGALCITEMYARMAPNVTMRTIRRMKKELLDEYLVLRHQQFHG